MKIAPLPPRRSPAIHVVVEVGPPTTPSRHDLCAKSLESSKLGNASVLRKARKLVEFGAKVSCMVLLAVDVVGNNWELNDFAGNARHFLTPLLSTTTVAQLQQHFAFPTDGSTSQLSLVGQFMIDRVLAQVHDTSGGYYRLTMGSHHSTKNSATDICGSLVRTYAHPPPNNSSTCTSIRLGVANDHVTFIRGNALTHAFGSSATRGTRGRAGDNAATLASLGYVPGRVGLDMRLTTAVSIPPPQRQVTANVTMYRFFAKALCTGCRPGTELGMDVCSIVYSYNERTNQVVVTSSSAVPGRAHALGMVVARRWGPILSQWLRWVGVVAALTGFAATQKTVQWVDKMSSSRLQRLVWLVAPPVRRLASAPLDFMSFCLNSDAIVLVFSMSVVMDEDVSTVYAGELRRWSDPSDYYHVWTQLRLWALDLRWIWFNLVILKALKCICHIVSFSRHSGTNIAMRWLNLRSVTWVYFTLGAIFARASFIEYGNSVRVDVASPDNVLDSIFVEFEQSWYFRALPSLVVLMVANVMVVVVADHILNRRWWRVVAKNSLCRQLIFNSTSIVADIHLTELHHVSDYVVAAIPARKLSTLRWYLGSHLTCFGLKEVPGVLKMFTSVGIPHTSRTGRRPSNAAGVAKIDNAVLSNVHFVVQDPNGYLHVCDSKAIEMQALRADASAVDDAQLLIG